MTANPTPPAVPRSTRQIPPVPAPDTSEGRVLVYALLVAIVYVLILIADATTLADQAAEFIELPLILGVIISFAVGISLTSQYARIRLTELELARTVSVHEGPDQMPSADSPLGKVMKEYVRTTAEFRRRARSHAYAAGPVVWGSLFALSSVVIWGIGMATGTNWPIYLALVLELPALVLLTIGVVILGTTVGVRQKVDGFDMLTPRRWRRFDQRNPTVDEVLQGCEWLGELYRKSATAPGPLPSADAPWSET